MINNDDYHDADDEEYLIWNKREKLLAQIHTTHHSNEYWIYEFSKIEF